jgi:hypothetical protein
MWKGSNNRNQVFQVKYESSQGWGEPIQVNRRPDTKMSFSKYEKEQLTESIGILTIAFTLALSNGLSPVMNDPLVFLKKLPLAFGAVMTGWLNSMAVGQNIEEIVMDYILHYLCPVLVSY